MLYNYLKSTSNQCLFAMIIGVIFGAYLPMHSYNFILVLGQLFVKFLYLIIIPLSVLTVVISSAKICNMMSYKKMFLWFIITGVFASIIAIFVGMSIFPHRDIMLSTSYYKSPILIFMSCAIVFGVVLNYAGNVGRQLLDNLAIFMQFMFNVTRFIFKFSPFAVFAVILPISQVYGLKSLLPLAKFLLVIYTACTCQLIFYTVLLLINRQHRLLSVFHGLKKVFVYAFISSSSVATLPTTISTLTTDLGVNERLANFIAPIAARIKMDGCGAIYPALVCILTARLFNIDLTTMQYITIVIISAIAMLGMEGSPATASVITSIVLLSIGLPLQVLILVMGIDKIVDMIRTSINVTGGAVVVLLLDSSKYNKERFS